MRHLTAILYIFALYFGLITLLASCSSDDSTGCNCKATIYKHAWTGEVKNFGSEPMDCNTQEPLEPIKEDKWYFIECKQNPSY